MVRKAIVKDLCDKCYEDTSGDLETDAEYCMVMVVNGNKTAYDLCDNHAKGMTVHEMIQEAHDVIPEKVESGKHIREKVRCQFCGKPYSAGSGMALHVKHQHPDELNKHKVVVTHD